MLASVRLGGESGVALLALVEQLRLLVFFSLQLDRFLLWPFLVGTAGR
jgi:hypothetical protein